MKPTKEMIEATEGYLWAEYEEEHQLITTWTHRGLVGPLLCPRTGLVFAWNNEKEPSLCVIDGQIKFSRVFLPGKLASSGEQDV